MPASGPRVRRPPSSSAKLAASASRGTPRSHRGSPRCRSSRSTRRARRRTAGADRPAGARISCASARRAGRRRRCARAAACASAATSASGTTRVTSPLSFASAASNTRPSRRISSAIAGPTRRTSGAISAIRHHEAEVLDRRAEAADAPQIRRSHSAAISSPPPTQMPWICATSGCRHAASASRGRRASCARTRSPAPCSRAGRELADVVAGRERPLAGTAQHDAAQRVVGRQRGDRGPRARHIVARQRVELLRTVEDDGRDRPVARHVDRFAHARPVSG